MSGQRGATLLEVMVVVFILLFTLLIIAAGVYQLSIRQKQRLLDQVVNAEAWAISQKYKVVAVTCAVIKPDLVNPIQRCTVRVEGRADPFSLDCNSYSNSCALTPNFGH